jgi:hypothetical protein
MKTKISWRPEEIAESIEIQHGGTRMAKKKAAKKKATKKKK